jgi:hypothetical protein
MLNINSTSYDVDMYDLFSAVRQKNKLAMKITKNHIFVILAYLAKNTLI